MVILCKGCLSLFDLMVELLDDSNLKYWAYCTELYKEENQKLSVKLPRCQVIHQHIQKMSSRFLLGLTFQRAGSFGVSSLIARALIP